MTLTDIISKVTRYAKKIIVNDTTGTGDALSITGTTGAGVSVTTTTGTALKLQQNHTTANLGGTLEIFKSTGGDFVYDGGTDALFTFNANSGDTRFDNTNVGIGITPTEKLDVFGIIRSRFSNIINGTSGAFKFVSCKTDDKARFDFGVDDTAESGSNAGSNFFIHRFNDAGGFVARVIQIKRNTGVISVIGLPTYANNAAAIAGGLVADDVYKTATGELRIVV